MLRSLWLLAVLSALASAQSLTVLKAARMFDGKADALVAPGIVVIDGNKIVAAGPSAQIPAGAKVIDLGDATLLPGFMDAHVHVSSGPEAFSPSGRLADLGRPATEQAIEASVNARKLLDAGFTTVRDLGSSDEISLGVRNAIQRGLTPGPRILAARNALGTTGGHCDETNGFRDGLLKVPGIDEGIANSPDGFRAAVRFQVKYGADVIKVCATGGVLSLNNDVDSAQLTQEELNALVNETHAKGRKAAAHAHGNEGARRAVLAGIDSIEHGSFITPETFDLMKQKGTVFIPTLMALYTIEEALANGLQLDPRSVRKSKIAGDAARRAFTTAASKGVTIGFGTDSGVFAHGRGAGEFALLVGGGLTPIQALKAATSVDAELFGVASSLGTLEAGKLADIVAVPGDPTADIKVTEKVLFVMKDGAVHKNIR